jgi:hypothetical protein
MQDEFKNLDVQGQRRPTRASQDSRRKDSLGWSGWTEQASLLGYRTNAAVRADPELLGDYRRFNNEACRKKWDCQASGQWKEVWGGGPQIGMETDNKQANASLRTKLAAMMEVLRSNS